MRKPIIVGNWKMNKTCAETVAFIEAIEPVLHDGATFGVGAPFTALKDACATAKNLVIAAENCHYKDNGAYTGEVSVPMLEELGVTHVIIGHSERRQMFGENDEELNLKAKRLFAAGMTPIFCIGETEAQYDAGETENVIRTQLAAGLKDLCPKCVSKMVIAYEPIWAIGTGKTATSEQAQEVCAKIRETVASVYGQAAADEITIQYGGSVNAANSEELFAKPDIDGGLVGGASLKANDFSVIVNS